MIHSARPIVSPVANFVFCRFVFLDLKSGDGQTDNMCENNDPYRPWLWVGRVDQFIIMLCVLQIWKSVVWAIALIILLLQMSLESICLSSNFVRKFAIKMIEDCGHFPHQEQPSLVNQEIKNFLFGEYFHVLYQFRI